MAMAELAEPCRAPNGHAGTCATLTFRLHALAPGIMVNFELRYFQKKLLCFNCMREPAKQRYQILVVDDEPSVCKAITMMLKYHGHEVQTANDGSEALTVYSSGHFDLVITDYLMPEMKGDQLAAQIKAISPRQRIMIVTAFAEDFLKDGKPTSNVDHVLSKPFTLEELREAVARVMS